MEDQTYIGQSVGSDLMHLELFIFDEWNQVTCSSEKININMLAPSHEEDWNTRLWLKEINSKGLNLLYSLNLS